MGVAGLWDILRPAARVRSLTDLAIKEGFEANPDGKRGFRLGIDASIWFFHAEYGREGENPVLRTLFFRCATLMHTTFLPIFVFDGPKRPDVKRGKKINRTSHKLIPGMKQIVEAFGFEWRMAPGEAEAELAYLNRIGVIDGILSDDVDNFLFGATTVIRNSSNTLSGNRANPILNAVGKDDKNHTRIFRLEDITNHADIRLTRGGMILIGLMSGGDYQQGGLMRCGTTTAHGLAKCGFGDTLYEAAINLDRESLADFLVVWRDELRQELRTNSKKELGRKQTALSNSITEAFPDIDILLSYVKPITSESMGRESNNLKLTWSKEPDLAKLAATCEFYFEWGYKEAIIKRFRTVIWPSIVLRILRRAVLDLDAASTNRSRTPTTPKKKGKEKDRTDCGTPSKMITKHFSSVGLSTPSKVYISGSESEEEDEEDRLIVKIHSIREHTYTDGLPEYRLEIAPNQLVKLAESGIQGIRSAEGPDEWASEEEDNEDGGSKKRGKKEPIEPETHLRLWMPACMVKLVEPQLVQDYEDEQEAKLLKKAKKGTRNTATKEKAPPKTKKAANPDDDSLDVFSAPPAEKPKKKAAATRKSTDFPPLYGDDDEGAESSSSNVPMRIEIPEKKTTASRTAAAPAPVHAEEEEESSDPDLPSRVREEPCKPRDARRTQTNARHGGEPSMPISSRVAKSRIGIKDLTKKKRPSASTGAVANDLKSFFSVTHSSSIHNKQTKAFVQSTTHIQSTTQITTETFQSSRSNVKQHVGEGSTIYSSSLSKNSKVTGSSKLSKSGASRALHDADDSWDEYDIALWNKKGAAAPFVSVSPLSKRKAREKNSPSESEPPQRLKKSPRKKATHTSPQSHQRPVSPSPSTCRFSSSQKHREIIEILTDSDDSDDSLPSRILPLKRLPPLMAARARSASGVTSSQSMTSATQKARNHVAHILPSDIIDLS